LKHQAAKGNYTMLKGKKKAQENIGGGVFACPKGATRRRK